VVAMVSRPGEDRPRAATPSSCIASHLCVTHG
jgi:hypothetical protein